MRQSLLQKSMEKEFYSLAVELRDFAPETFDRLRDHSSFCWGTVFLRRVFMDGSKKVSHPRRNGWRSMAIRSQRRKLALSDL